MVMTDRISEIAQYLFDNLPQFRTSEEFASLFQSRWPDCPEEELKAALAELEVKLKIQSIERWDKNLERMLDLESTATEREARGGTPNRTAIRELWEDYWRLRERHTEERRN